MLESDQSDVETSFFVEKPRNSLIVVIPYPEEFGWIINKGRKGLDRKW